MFSPKMAKRAQIQTPTPVRSEKVDVGCMWDLVRMFGFRRSWKLLAHKKHGIVRSELSNSKDLDDDTVEVKENGAEKVHSGRPSIKVLIEEKMVSTQSSKQHTSEEFGNLDEKRTSASLDVSESLKAPEENEIDINLAASLIMDLCRYHNQFKDTGSDKDSAPASDTIVNGDLVIPSNPDKDVDQKSSDIQKTLDDIAKAVRNHPFLNKEHLIGSNAARSEELINALQLISSNKELFLKLLQDPDFPLMEYLQHLYIPLGNPNLEPVEFVEETKLPDDTQSPKQIEVTSTEQPGKQRRQNLFSKEDKLVTKKPSKSNDSSRVSRIVILKPSSASFSPQLKGNLQAHEDGDKSPRLFSAPGPGSFSCDEDKKHLAQRLDGQEHSDNSRIVRKSVSLGRLLSFPGYDTLSPTSRSTPEEPDLSQQETQSYPSQQTEQDKSVSFGDGSCSPDVQKKVAELMEPSNRADNLPRAIDSCESLTKENLDNIPVDVPESVNSLVAIPPDSPESLRKELEDLNSSAASDLPTTYVTTSPISTQNTPEKQEQPSPNSVLDSSFSGENINLTRRTTKHNEVVPSRFPFRKPEIHSVPPSLRHTTSILEDKKTRVSILEDKKTRVAFIREVLKASELCEEAENSEIWYNDDPLLGESSFVDVEASYDDVRLLFNCIDEVLLEIRVKYFLVSYRNNIARPAPVGEKLIQEVTKRVDWHLRNQFPNTLHQMKNLDNGTWMDLRLDRENIALESGDYILDNLLEELVSEMWL